MSKAKKSKPVVATVEALPVVQAAPIAPVATGRTIVDIARGLKLDPRVARRIARANADALGRTEKGQRWLLTPDSEKAFIDMVRAHKS